MEPIFLTCMVIAYFFTKGKVDTAAYANGKESPGVAKARMRHEAGGGARSASGRPKGKGAFRLMLADRWANACESARQRGEHKAKRRRAWYAETAPLKDQKWREKKLRRLRNAEAARRKWAERQGLIDLSEFRDRKAEEEAWAENERRDAEAAAAAAAATTDPAAAPTGTDPAPAADPAKPDEAKPTEDAATDGKDETKPDAEKPDTAPADTEKTEEPAADETKADEKAEDSSTTPDGSTTPTEPQPAADTDPAAAGTGEAAKADTPAGSATTPKNTDAAGKAGDSVYNAAADRLINAAERVEQYRADLATMADGLDGKKWGVEVHGPIRDMDGHLSTVASTYRDLAGQMQQQGDNVSDAHDAHPYVPADAEVVFA